MRKGVLYLSTSSGPGGAERLVSRLASAINDDSFRSLVCLFRPGWIQGQCEKEGIPTVVFENHGVFDTLWIRQVLSFMRQEVVHLIHAHEFDAIVHGTLVAAIARLPIVATIHGKNYYGDKVTRRIAYRLASRYAHMVAVSEDLKRFVIKQTGISDKRIGVIYNGIEPFPDVTSVEQEQLRNEIGLTQQDQIVGTVGSLYPIKGHQVLIEAVPAIVRICPQAKFLLVGRGDEEVRLQDQARILGVEKYVLFLGLRQDIAALLSIMDVFVLPSLSEGLSVAALEAMVSAKPIVATNVGGNPELIKNEETGFLVPSQDSRALANAIVALLQDASRARAMGVNGRARVRERFQWKTMVDRYRDVYENALKS